MRKIKPRLYRGFRDVFAGDLIARNKMIEKIRAVYERYGFLPLETPAIEYVDVLGKFLPEANTPEGGIFSFRNEDKEWIALRYDLTAPLSRVVAQYGNLQKPYRRYQAGPVWRFEKPGPGRFREFYQFDFDSVGTASMMADSEVCCVMCDALEAAGINRGEYLVKVNNRKVLNGVLDAAGLLGGSRTVDVLRSIDKLDKIGIDGVHDLLTKGRLDPSGDFMTGLELSEIAVATIMEYLKSTGLDRSVVCDRLRDIVGKSAVGIEGIQELRDIDAQLSALGYNSTQVVFDPTVVRGLSYYTGPVFEGVLMIEMKDEDGVAKSFGSVFGGGRYDDLVERFTGHKVPATGASIGVDRLLSALKHLGRIREQNSTALVLVTVMNSHFTHEYQRIAQSLRKAGINTELFTAKASIGAQLKYADSQGIPVAVIVGEDELKSEQAQIKDLRLGRKLSETVSGREEWRRERPAQISVPRSELINSIKNILSEYGIF